MEVRIEKGTAKGVITAPPSKSYAHRLLIGAALSGHSTIHNVSFSNDIKATISCLESLGYKFDVKGDIVSISSSDKTSDIFDCQESGSTLRFMIPIVMVKRNHAVFRGTEKLFSRGLSVYEDIFKQQGIRYELGKDYLEVFGSLKPGLFKVDASISSQFITGLLFASSIMSDDSEIELLGEVESAPYIDITIDVLNAYGIKVKKEGNKYHVKGNQKYLEKDLVVEGDYSNAAFLDALNYLGGDVKVLGLNPDSKQGDKKYIEYFKLLDKGHPSIDISNCIDLGPILFTMAAIKNGAVITGINRLRIKESDRVQDMLKVLELFGVKYSLNNNKIEIFGGNLHENSMKIVPANDHRIVMAASVLLTRFGGVISNVEAVNKSYPNFFEDLRELGIGVYYENI